MDSIRLRPHHGLCLLNFIGKGYGDAFTENMQRMKERLTAHPETIIRIAEGSDDLCSCCPHRIKAHCDSEKPPVFDARVLEAAGIRTDRQLTWAELSRIMEPVRAHRLAEICGNCSWFSVCSSLT